MSFLNFGSPCTRERALSLGGMLLALDLVDQMASKGFVDDEPVEHLVTCLLDLNGDPERFFEPLHLFTPGFARLSQLLENNQAAEASRAGRYFVQISQIADLFSKNEALKVRTTNALEQVQRNRHDKSTQALCQDIADLYQETISTLPLRIQVQGQPGFLRQPHVAAKIRCLLFCAIRFSFLWRQTGGSRSDFVFRKNSIRNQLAGIRQQLPD